MNITHHCVLLLALSLMFSACKTAEPTDTADQPTATGADKPADAETHKPGAGWEINSERMPEPVQPLGKLVSEWIDLGLSEEQIRSKISEGQQAGHLHVTPLTNEATEKLKADGASDELITFLGELDLEGSPAEPAEPATP